jgi:hypothetical protein
VGAITYAIELETVMILAATNDGIRDVETGAVTLAGRDVTHLVCTGDTSWALVDGGRRVLHAHTWGDWEEIAGVDGAPGHCLHPLSKGGLLVGTEGAHVLRLEDRGLRRLPSFDAVPGRDRWKNPASAEPAVWSFAALGESVFVSVHVGGLWRSDDQGETWTASLEPGVDVHQVAASGAAVMVAAARGFAWSRDAGRTWAWTTSGLHAAYLQSIAATRDTVFVGAASGPFAEDCAVYCASPPGTAFERRAGELPGRLATIGPYRLAAAGRRLAVATRTADVFTSTDAGASWAHVATGLPQIRNLVVTSSREPLRGSSRAG